MGEGGARLAGQGLRAGRHDNEAPPRGAGGLPGSETPPKRCPLQTLPFPDPMFSAAGCPETPEPETGCDP